MLEWLLTVDRELFLKINRDWHHPWADAFFPFFTDLHKHWYFPWVFFPWLVFVFVRQFGKKGFGLILGMLLCVGTSDLVGGRIVKPQFERQRPSTAEAEAVVRGIEYGGFSFTSNHSANTFAGAIYLAQWLPQGKIVFIAIAATVAYSRVYIGVHYPFDVLVGAVLGILIALLWVRIMEKLLRLRRPVP